MYLIFDTETSGLPNYKADLDDPCQPYILQLAFVVLDKEFHEVAVFNSYINNNCDFIIEAGAFDAHHITHNKCLKCGIPMCFALDVFEAHAVLCDKIVSYNLKFDSTILDIQATRINGTCFTEFKNKGICAMEASTNICKKPYKDPRKTGFKWPKLEEAFVHMYPEEPSLVNAHNALNDVRTTAKVFEYLVKNNYVTV